MPSVLRAFFATRSKPEVSVTCMQSLNNSFCVHERSDDIEREACLAVGLLAIKPEHQKRIADSNALPRLVALLKRRVSDGQTGRVGDAATRVARRAADAITNLAHENVLIKNRVRYAYLQNHSFSVARFV